MKPEQFIRWYGIEDAKYLIEQNINCNDFEFSLEDLKRLVESLEIVNRACGAERVIDLHERYKNNPVAHKYWLGVRVDRMAQAVTDYESIYGGGENA